MNELQDSIIQALKMLIKADSDPIETQPKKVIDLVDSPNYQYSVGAVVSYFPKRKYVKIKFYLEGEWKKYLMSKSDFTLTESKR